MNPMIWSVSVAASCSFAIAQPVFFEGWESLAAAPQIYTAPTSVTTPASTWSVTSGDVDRIVQPVDTVPVIEGDVVMDVKGTSDGAVQTTVTLDAGVHHRVGFQYGRNTFEGTTTATLRFDLIGASASVSASLTHDLSPDTVLSFEQAFIPQSSEVTLRFVSAGSDAPNAGVVIDSIYIAPGCNVADLAPPFGIVDLDDADAFIGLYVLGDPSVDFVPPQGIVDLDDFDTFLVAFLAGCP